MSSADERAPASLDRTSQAIIVALMLGHATLTASLAFARYATFHNRTFDLALYARAAWGLVHAQAWDPIVGGNFLGGHLPFVLAPLGLLGRVFGTVPVLLIAQSIAVALPAWPLSQLGARRLGRTGGVVAALAWLLYPNLAHVATYEFHPGTLGLWPLCHALDVFDRKQPRALVWLCVATVACRASLALQTMMLGLLALRAPALRRHGGWIVLGSGAYFLLWQFWLQPRFGQAPQAASDLHFGKWGGSPLGVLSSLVRSPAKVLEHFSAPAKLSYLPVVLAPLAFLPVLRPRLLLVALPPLALNLLSSFPTASELYSHYLTPAIPALVVAALDGLAALFERGITLPVIRVLGLASLLVASLGGSVLASGLPWSRDFVAGDFSSDAATRSARNVMALIEPQASLQAPDALLPHFAERPLVCRVPPPDRGTDFVVLDLTHRARFAHEEALLRTTEEPLVRAWLARPDRGVVYADSRLLVLRRGISPRSGVARSYFAGRVMQDEGIVITACIALRGAELRGAHLQLTLVARGACPHDLAIRLGADETPTRVELLFDGLLSPVHLQRGDLLHSSYDLTPEERDAITRRGLHVGALRSSGARPQPIDPISVEVPLRVVY